MKFSFVEPLSELKPYVQSIWIVESPVGLPPSQNNLAAPNGCPKLIFNYQNSIVSTVEGKLSKSKEHELYFVGTRECPTFVHTKPGKTCCIGIEFYPQGAYPFFRIPMSELTNQLLPAELLLSSLDREFIKALPELKGASEAVEHIQNQLVKFIGSRQPKSLLVDYCVNSLRESDGLIAVSDLERMTGYTRRYLEILFRDHVGFSPKVLAGIFRFQKFYRAWAQKKPYEEIEDELYDYYYDQAHFVKNFKRLTGFSPQQFTTKVSNEFGRQLLLHH